MMFKQISDVLNEISIVYDNLYRSYENLQEFLNDEKSKEMMKYIKDKKNSFSQMLNNYKESGHVQVLKSWLQYSPEYSLDSTIDKHDLKQNSDIDRLNQHVVQIEEWLLNFYAYIINTTSSSKTKEVFEKILERQKKDNKTLSAVVNTFLDI